MVTVALSMLTLVPGGMGGSETYARELTRQLSTVPSVHARAFVPGNVGKFSQGIFETAVSEVSTGTSTARRVRSLVTIGFHAARLSKLISASDVVHYPFTVAAPRPAKGTPWIQSLLDVQHLELPALFSTAELTYRKLYYEGGARQADAVITISEFAKTRMVELLGLDPDKIHVAHLGVDASRFTPNLGDRSDFVLYPARGWQHKNHARLIVAMERVRSAIPGMKLVLTGGGLDRLGELPDWIERRGLVSDDDLRSLYKTARVLAFPSLYEGFGLPPLEAMASGCPVAASNVGSIPEVCGSAAILFDPTNTDAIADGILAAIDGCAELQSAGVNQVRAFTWERCRDVHGAVYRGFE